ncbi:MAG: hypothetical protein PHW31_03470 [Candidatus Pacebacteria bacterium]|nr:hypothetical protein [Candidatus Paceibacterota bacterium]
MLIFLHGSDDYRLGQKLNEIVSQYTEKYGSSLDLAKVNLQEESEKVFWDILKQSSLFMSKKLLVVENAFSNQNFKKTILKKIKDLSASSHVLVFIETKEIKPADSFLLALKENGKAQEFSALTGVKLKAWLKKHFEQSNSFIEEAAAQKLLDYVGADMWRLANEAQKLAAFKKIIGLKDVELLVRPKIEAEIFKTIDSFASKNKRLAFEALQRHLDLGESPIYLLSMLSYQTRNLLLVKSNPGFGANNLGMHPFVFRKSVALAGNFSLEQLKKACRDIFSADLKIKIGQDKPEQALKSLIAAI